MHTNRLHSTRLMYKVFWADRLGTEIFPPILHNDFMQDLIFCIGVMCCAGEILFEVGTTNRAQPHEQSRFTEVSALT